MTGEKPWWEAAKPAAQPVIPSRDPDQAGTIPWRRTPQGPQFDPTAGVLGSLLRTITTPGDILLGNVPTPYGGGSASAPDAVSRAAESAWNISPMSPSYRAGARFGTVTPLAEDAWLPSWRGNLTKAPLTPPPAGDIYKAGDTGYTALRESGLGTPSGPLSTLAGDIQTGYGERFSPESAKSTFTRLDMMQNPKRSVTSMADLMAHRDDLTATIGKGGSDAVAAYEARDALDRYISDLGAGNVSAMPGATPTMAPEQISPTLEAARGNTKSAIAANKISGDLDPAATGFIEKAEGRTGPGRRPVVMQLEDRAAAILEKNKEFRSFAPDEVEALKTVRDGTATRNTLEWFGRRFGGTDLASTLANSIVGAGTHFGAGGSGWGGLLAAGATQVGGLLAKAAANAMARGQTRVAEELVRRNSPLARSLVENQTLSYSPGTARDAAIMRILGPGLLAPPDTAPLPAGVHLIMKRDIADRVHHRHCHTAT